MRRLGEIAGDILAGLGRPREASKPVVNLVLGKPVAPGDFQCVEPMLEQREKAGPRKRAGEVDANHVTPPAE